MIAEICIGVLLALVIARIVAVLLRRLWNEVAVLFISAWPKEQDLPAWFFVTSEVVTNERWDDR